MPTDSISVQVTPVIARFIRTKVKNGDYPSTSALIRDAIERMRVAEVEAESSLTKSQKRRLEAGVTQGIADMESGRYDEFDSTGLRTFAKELVAASAARARGRGSRPKA
jgi:putative addiction module CopG family antidote